MFSGAVMIEFPRWIPGRTLREGRVRVGRDRRLHNQVAFAETGFGENRFQRRDQVRLAAMRRGENRRFFGRQPIRFVQPPLNNRKRLNRLGGRTHVNDGPRIADRKDDLSRFVDKSQTAHVNVIQNIAAILVYQRLMTDFRPVHSVEYSLQIYFSTDQRKNPASSPPPSAA